ncbi:hypothetical protein HaLaN_05317 [Haematococcus lacustris]|uniref:Secreted protein n=1 Tax=Haematococcus lacustris TaxID=44745 RepID=A0A699YUG4_HAELA|nr:hypothetical protein HaLaN_05317 [Haematococcus lacustris]
MDRTGAEARRPRMAVLLVRAAIAAAQCDSLTAGPDGPHWGRGTQATHGGLAGKGCHCCCSVR